jgi:hypothetical protein
MNFDFQSSFFNAGGQDRLKSLTFQNDLENLEEVFVIVQ